MKLIAISDLHGNLPDKMPEGDLLLIAGDVCPDYRNRVGPQDLEKWGRPQREWFLTKFQGWLENLPIPSALMTWGNHDWLEDRLLPCVKIDELVEHDGLKIWFSPWSNEFCGWSWMKEPEALKAIYNAIPEGIDILVSHQPPFGHCDTPGPPYGNGTTHVGSKELFDAIIRVQPDIVLCGHIHGGYGHSKIGRTTVYNVSLVDEAYRPVNPVTVIEV
jgi:hypothetical protein